jgi:HAD superfamily hydrolase (TIGR01490 family)
VRAWVPLVFIWRGVIVDTIRSTNAVAQGMAPFALMRSRFGKFIVASKFVRVLYAVVKASAFTLLALQRPFPQYLPELWAYVGGGVTLFTYSCVYLAVLLCVARGAPVIAEFVYSQKNDILRRPGRNIDGTLVRGSTERRFWRYLLARRRQGPRQILAGALFLVRFLPRYGIHVAKKNKAYLVGLTTADVAALAADFVAREALPRLYAPAVQRLQQHLQGGDTVALLSGTLEPIARALAQHLGVQHVCATACAERDGRYLAQPPVVHPFGAQKAHVAAELAAQLGTDLQRATAYADSVHDLKLLEAVGSPVAVQPDRRLLRAARAKAWDVIAADAGDSVPSKRRAAERGYM